MMKKRCDNYKNMTQELISLAGGSKECMFND